MTHLPRFAIGVDTLECSGCHRMLPDADFHRDARWAKRRGRRHRCIECERTAQPLSRHGLIASGALAMCPTCDEPQRRPGQYICSHCAQFAPMFNHVRPPEMQGRAVPIFAPWAKGRS